MQYVHVGSVANQVNIYIWDTFDVHAILDNSISHNVSIKNKCIIKRLFNLRFMVYIFSCDSTVTAHK